MPVFIMFIYYFPGKAIAESILAELAKYGMQMSQCRGQAYDGASSMAGALNGCAAIIRNEYPLAVYQHCRSHALNLAIMKTATSVTEISKLCL